MNHQAFPGKRFIHWTLIWTCLLLVYYGIYQCNHHLATPKLAKTLLPPYQCPHPPFNQGFIDNFPANRTFAVDERILLIKKSKEENKNLLNYLYYFKIPIRIQIEADNLFYQLLPERGRFSAIIFEDYRSLFLLSADQKRELLKYCSKFQVPLISFLLDVREYEQFSGFVAKRTQNIISMRVYQNSFLNRLATTTSFQPHSKFSAPYNWTLFNVSPGIKYETVIEADVSYSESIPAAIIIREDADVKHFISGSSIEHWIVKIALLELISPIQSLKDLERYIKQILLRKSYIQQNLLKQILYSTD
jgi:hypothetical protein